MSVPTPKTPGYTSFRGRTACDCLAEWLVVFEKELLRRKVIKYNIDIYQLTGTSSKSGGTHSQGGAFDIAQTQDLAIWVARQMGADATWHRPYNWDNDHGGAHTHGVLRGCPHNTPARYQYTSDRFGVDHNHNGLANGAKDTGPRPLSNRTWKQGIAWAKRLQAAAAKPNVLKTTAGIVVSRDGTATLNISATKACSGWVQIWDDEKGVHVSDVKYYKFAEAGWQPLHFTNVPVISTSKALARVKQEKPVDGANPQFKPLTLRVAPAPSKPLTLRPMTMNLPDEVKIPNAAKRIVAGVAVAKKANPDFVGGQEWVGHKADGTASSHAAAIAKAWGTGYQLVIPTLPLNENYLLLKTAAVKLVKQYPDFAIRAKVGTRAVGGRHITLAVCKDVASGREFLWGNSQLVNNDHVGAQAQAVLVMAELLRIQKLEGGIPIVFTADANTPNDLKAFVEAGLVNTRKKAAATTGAQYATYTNQTKTVPSVNVADWTIDQIWCSPEFDVGGYTQVMALTSTGKFIQPRGSDHVPVIAALTTK